MRRHTHAAALRRRHRVLLLSLLPASFAGCAEAPVFLKYEAKAAIERARESRAGEFAPEALARAEEAFGGGVRAMDAESARWAAARDFGVAQARLSAALRRARLSEELALGRRRDLEARTGSLLATARGSVDNLRFILSYLPPRTRARSDLMRARVLCEEAEVLARSGDLALALERAREASQQLALLSGTLARIIERHTSTERLGLYRRWIRDTVEESAASGGHAILVDKLRHTLTVLKAGRVVQTYRAEMGLNGHQDKSVAGDRATPEGRYRIIEKRGPGRTRWYKALLLDYPNEQDRVQFAEEQRKGLIPRRAKIGGLIEVHGEGGRYQDWTDGCVALANDDMDELFDLIPVGTPITIVGYEGEDWFQIPGAGGKPPRRASGGGGAGRRRSRR